MTIQTHRPVTEPVEGDVPVESGEVTLTPSMLLLDGRGRRYIGPVLVAVDGEVVEVYRLESRPQVLQPWEKNPDCPTCVAMQDDESLRRGPAHEGSPRCRSGGHPHCTCDTCF